LRHRLAELAVAAAPLAVGAVSGVLTAAAIPTWYRTLDKPAWNPPDWIFGPVWTTLYLLMGVAVLLVWRRDHSEPRVRVALAAFAVQLALNFGWSLIFFGRRDVGLALAEIVLLHAAIVATIVAFGRVRPPAALLLIPYLGWVSFATILNAEIWRLNG
jgi:tryptophan-rich sensory protein